MTDEIVEQIRTTRREHAEKFGFDLDAIFEDLKRREGLSGRRIVSLPPKRPKPADASGRAG